MQLGSRRPLVRDSSASWRANNAEGGTHGTQVTSGNSGGASGRAFDSVDTPAGSAITFDNTHPAHGALGYKTVFPTAAARTAMIWTSASIGSVPEAWGRGYMYLPALPAAGRYITLCVLDHSGVGSCAAVAISDAGKLMVFDANGSIRQSTAAITAAALFRIEWYCLCNAATGIIEAKLFAIPDASVATETVTFSGTNTLDLITALPWGPDGSTLGAGFVVHYDDLNFNTRGYPGPA